MLSIHQLENRMRFFLPIMLVLVTLGTGQVEADDVGAKLSNQSLDLFGDPLPGGAIARIGTVRLRHAGPVYDLSFAPDGTRLATAGEDGVRIWDSKTGQELDAHGGSRVQTFCVSFAPNGRIAQSAGSTQKSGRGVIAAGGGDMMVHLWDALSERPASLLAGHTTPVRSVAFSPDGTLLASGSGHQNDQRKTTIIIWQTATSKKLKELSGHRLEVISLAFSPDGRWLLSGSHDRSVRLWDVSTGKEIRQFARGTGPAVFSPDGKWVAAGHDSATVGVWETITGKEAPQFSRGAGRLNHIAFSPDGRTIASVAYDPRIRLWDVSTRQELPSISITEGWFSSVRFSPDGKILAAGNGHDHSIGLWETATRKPIVSLMGPAGSVDYIGLSQDGRQVVTASNFGRSIGLWETASGKAIRPPVLVPFGARCTAFATNGRTLALACFDRLVLWDFVTGKQQLVMQPSHRASLFGTPEPPGPVEIVAMSSGDNLTAFGSRSSSRSTVYLCDSISGKILRTLAPDRNFTSLAFLPDRPVLAGFNSQITLWDVLTGREVGSFPQAGYAEGVALGATADNRFFATWHAPGYGLRLWDAETGKKIRDCGEERQIACVALSPDGKSALLEGGDGSIQLWELATGLQRAHFSGHRGKLTCAAFGRDGRTILVGCSDCTALLWDATFPAGVNHNTGSDLDATALKLLWNVLDNADAAVAYDAMCTLIHYPRSSLEFLRQKVKPALPVAAEQISKLILDLDSPQYQARKQATEELEQLGEIAAPVVKRRIGDKPPLEMRQRLLRILARYESRVLAPQNLRELRAVEILERIGTPAARQILAGLTKGPPEARLTQEASGALARLGHW